MKKILAMISLAPALLSFTGKHGMHETAAAHFQPPLTQFDFAGLDLMAWL